ncbi:MAG TPA: GreA/GreB family elongation factor [Jatrophihabitans sp.]|jgi:transcription elongation factor GreA|nr:GreA/GreB family elongation factor [Jatrophihabitans sp.]
MTATLTAESRTDALSHRLAELYIERKQLLAEVAPVGSGDEADRATNVDGHVQLAMLEQRIVALENELAARPAERKQEADGSVSIGDVVTVDLGDGPETYLLGTVEEAAAGVDVITPSSPLGKVLQGASVGATLTYAARPGQSLQAEVLAIE